MSAYRATHTKPGRRRIVRASRTPGLGESLALAACSLLGSAAQAGEGAAWQVDAAVLNWAETDRVSAVEPEVSVRHDLGDDRYLGFRVVLDTLSGASHNGARVQSYPQTFSSASGGGGGGYTVPAGAVPLDPSFEDFRTAVSVSYEAPLENRLWKKTLGANMSSETDFLSLGASGTLSRDFNKRNTTLTGGLSLESDSISPSGGAPAPFAVRVMGGGGEGEGEGEGGGGGGAAAEAPAESRVVVDTMIGLTQVINRSTLMQFNVGFSQASGYMNDPYKIITVNGPPGVYVYENRPDSRSKMSFYIGGKHAFESENIVDIGYRFMSDDWGVVSHTVDLFYRIQMGNWYLEPHARWYTQSAADFFVMSLAPADVPAEGSFDAYASGDYRLGALVDTTVGAKLGVKLSEGAELYVRSEQFKQTGDWAPANMDATILEFGGSWKF